MTQPDNTTQSTPDGFSLALLCLVVAAMPTQYGQTVKHLTSSGGTAFERTISVGDAMLGLAFFLWGLRVLTRWRWRECRWPSVACVGLVVVAALSAMHSELIAGEITHAGGVLKAVRSSLMVRTSLKEWVQFVIYALIAYTLFVNLLKETRFVRGSLYIVFGVATLAVVLGLKDYFLVADPKLVRAGIGESAYLFNSQNIYSGFLAMMFPLMLAVAVSTRNMAVRIWLGACVVLGAVTMLGAGGLLATFLVLPTCAFRHDRRAGWLVAAAMATLLVLLIAPRTRSYRDGLRPLFTGHDSEGDVSKQYVEWQAGLGMLEDHPLFGVGTGLYQLNIGAYYGALPNKEKMPWDSNSLYLVVASTMGLAGLAALLYFLVHPLLMANGLIGSLSGDDRALMIGLWGSILAFMVTSGLNCLWVRGTAPVLVYLIAIVAVLNRAEAAERSGQRRETMGTTWWRTARPTGWLAGVGLIGAMLWAPSAAVAGSGKIVIETESADEVVPHFVLKSTKDKDVSGGKYLEIPDKACGEHKEDIRGYATYTLDVKETGAYYLWLRVWWLNGCGNSVWAQIDGEPKASGDEKGLVIGEDGTYKRWGWKSAKNFKFRLTAGKHKLTLTVREDGPRFDQILLTKDDTVPVRIEKPTAK